MILNRIFGRKDNPAEALYAAIVAAARQEDFYTRLGVADTIDGRFDVLILHMYLVLDRLRALGEQAATPAQELTDLFFREMDRALREMGVGDLSVGKKVRKMAEAFYGRVNAYNKAWDEEGDALAKALARNIYADATPPAGAADELAAYARNAKAALASQSLDDMLAGRISFT